jgi:hypothetical protein
MKYDSETQIEFKTTLGNKQNASDGRISFFSGI